MGAFLRLPGLFPGLVGIKPIAVLPGLFLDVAGNGEQADKTNCDRDYHSRNNPFPKERQKQHHETLVLKQRRKYSKK